MAELYPFTFGGTATFILAVYLFGTGFASGNLYAFTFSTLLFFLLALLIFCVRIQIFRMSGTRILWSGNEPLYSRLQNADQLFHTGNAAPFYFFRFHVVLKGRLEAGRKTPLRFYRESSASRGGEIRIPLYFPVCGILNVEERLHIRDVFGFVRGAIGAPEFRTVPVRPPTFPDRTAYRFDRTFSEESSKNVRSGHEEKYFMREYQAGDRMKDINWKSSIRIAQLITRISPLSPEKSKLIHVEFRNISVDDRDDPVSIMHLNYLKSWLLSFLYGAKHRDEEYRFIIQTAEQRLEIDTVQDIDRFADLLATLNFVGHDGGTFKDENSVRFIFSTPYDPRSGIPAASAKNFYRTGFAKEEGAGKRRLRFLHPIDLSVIPGLWLFRRLRKRKTGVATGGVVEALDVHLF